jgi:hypothetical protein
LCDTARKRQDHDEEDEEEEEGREGTVVEETRGGRR